jgi:hypothetical protein
MPEPGARRQITPRGLLFAALWGASTTLLAYALSFGSVPVFILLLVTFGVLLRLAGWTLAKRRGNGPPRGWWT